MKLIRFGISRFRLFTKQIWLDMKQPTILIGPNNEGKTTICDALNIFFGQRHLTRRAGPRRRLRAQPRIHYDLNRDYPNSITIGRRWPTEFRAILELAPSDMRYLPPKFKNKTELEMIKQWSYEDNALVEVIDGLNSTETSRIVRHLYKTMKIVSIPAIRMERDLEGIFEDVFSQSIEARVEKSRKIKGLKRELTKLLTPEVKSSIRTINKTFKDFLKQPIKVDFDWDISVSNAVDLKEIKADDGNVTNIALKGDGIKSLMQMALLTQYAEIEEDRATSKNNIYVIEEPESHLNSSYLHDLKAKIIQLSKNSTTILTTHSSVFVNFGEIDSNHLVAGGKVRPAKNKKDIADALGVRVQENLVSNMGVIYLEGYDDAIALNTVLSVMKCKNEVKSHFDILYAEGASKIANMILSNHTFFKEVFVILDNDKAGRDAKKQITRCVKDAVIIMSPLLDGCKDSEMEDLLTLECQSKIFTAHYNMKFPLEVFLAIRKRHRCKWSKWIPRVFNQVGIPFDDEDIVKRILWSKARQIEFSEPGKEFLKNLINTVRNNHI